MMKKSESRWWMGVVVIAAILMVCTPLPCWAESLPGAAARFIEFYERTAIVAGAECEREVGLWERFLYSLILASSAPAEGAATSS